MLHVQALNASLAESLNKKCFLVIGRAGMDFYPEPPGTTIEQATHFVSHLGGSSANIAVALVKQGVEAALLTRVSDDAIGAFCLRQLDHYGVNRDWVKTIGGEYRNSLAVSESTLVDHKTVIYRNGAADFQMSEEDVVNVEYSQFGAIITTGTVLAAEPSRQAAFKAFELAAEQGIPLVFDVDYRPYSWASADEASQVYSKAASMCDIIIGNDVEFGFMAGDYDKGLEKARALSREHATIVVYKRGELGAITITAEQEFTTGVYPANALKPTGAGDSFMGGFLASLSRGTDIRTAVLRGSACASMVVSAVGCAPAMPSLDQLDEFLANHPEPIND